MAPEPQNGAVGTPWSKAMIDDLKALLGEGQSFGRIAKVLSAKYRPVTRSAAIGKATRLKLAGRGASFGTTGRRKPTLRVAPVSRKQSSQNAKSSPWRAASKTALQNILEKAPADLVPEPDVVAAGERQSILRRNKNGDIEANPLFTAKSCRWPIGDPTSDDFYFCCREAVAGAPYCEAHARRAYVPLQTKRQQKANSVQALSDKRETNEIGRARTAL
jgi:GcrA cell cycle regulator